MYTMKRLLFLILVSSVLLFSCETSTTKGELTDNQIKEVAWQMPDTAAYLKYGKPKLSDYGFFEGPLVNLNPASRVFHYDINTPLFSDYALKKRFIYLPEGTSMEYNGEEVMDFPVGTVLIKNFYFEGKQLKKEGASRILETRLLLRESDGWKALPYLWNEEQTEAYLEITGRQIPVALVNTGIIEYSVPNMLQCKSCHDKNGQIIPLGPSARQLNKISPDGSGNQLAQLINKGWLHGAPVKDAWPAMVPWEDPSQPLAHRARAYLEVNCAHCHREGGPGKNSGLDLTVKASDPLAMGIFKAPVAAGKGSGGLKFDIVPGNPDESILVYRMESIDPAVMMPELGRSVVHSEGVALIREWVASLNRESL